MTTEKQAPATNEEVQKALTTDDHAWIDTIEKETYLNKLISLKNRLFNPMLKNPTTVEIEASVHKDHLHFFKSMSEVLRLKL